MKTFPPDRIQITRHGNITTTFNVLWKTDRDTSKGLRTCYIPAFSVCFTNSDRDKLIKTAQSLVSSIMEDAIAYNGLIGLVNEIESLGFKADNSNTRAAIMKSSGKRAKFAFRDLDQDTISKYPESSVAELDYAV
jgi:hypothetical protein